MKNPLLTFFNVHVKLKNLETFGNNFTPEANPRIWGAVLFSFLIVLGFCGEIKHWVQNNLPAQQLFQWRAIFSIVVWVSHYSEVISLEMESLAKNRILIEEEQDKKNFLPLPSFPVSERPTQPLTVMRSHPFGTRIQNVPDFYCYKFVWIVFINVTVYVF